MIFFEQLGTLRMFFSGFKDVENHVVKSKNYKVSIFRVVSPIYQPVTGWASIQKIFFFDFIK